MIQFHACPRCHGDLIDGSDQYGSYLACFQCGRYVAKPSKKPSGAGKISVNVNADLAELLAP